MNTKYKILVGSIVVAFMLLIILVINVAMKREDALKTIIAEQQTTIEVLKIEAKHSKLLKELL